ncbi:MAG: hypothetical protein BGO67_04125 [Alphaproteobacteria bacterium 41-28]|nr:MAG: hypothetical protein BGO67_04125 [Alphaproteobacteria bacterium 41-28]
MPNDTAENLQKNLTYTYQEVWERRSSIRTRPSKLIDFTKMGYFFPESKQPLLLHPEIINKGEDIKYEILLQSFKKYLIDIITLEIKMIDSACRMIIEDDLPVYYDDQVKLNANTVMIDEYYHVYIARSMLHQINQHFLGLKSFSYPISDASHAVYKLQSSLDKEYCKMFHIIAVCIFETTLVRELIDFFNAEDIHPCIKHYVNDHMNDEAKHYGFFYDLLCYTWNNLSEDFKNVIGQCLAEFIKLYLHIDSDKLFYQKLCESYVEDKDKSIQIVNDLYKGFVISPDIPIVKNVMNVLKKSNITSHNATKSGFAKIGWNI